MMSNPDLLIYLALSVGILMALGIGANDFSNSVGPAVGGKVFGLVTALVIAAVFEFAGAMLHGANVTETIRADIVDMGRLGDQPMVIYYGMVSALLGAAAWLAIASAKGWPVSTTHAIIGAMVGFGILVDGFEFVRWDNLTDIASGWIVSPVVGAVVAYLLMKSIFVLILNSSTPARAVKRWGPIYVVLAGFVVALAMLFKGLKLFVFELMGPDESLLFALLVGSMLSLVGFLSFLHVRAEEVEHAFYPMILFTVCATAFAHGANDVANSVGPMAVALDALAMAGKVSTEVLPPAELYLVGAIGIIFGMALFGRKVVHTVGSGITSLSPCRAFSASLSTAGTVVTASTLGLPVSTTHILIGAVVGVGLAESTQRVNWPLIRTIIISWAITIPAAAMLSAIIFWWLPILIEGP